MWSMSPLWPMWPVAHLAHDATSDATRPSVSSESAAT